MKHASPLDSPKNIFNQSQAVKGPQILKPNTNVIKNLGVNFEDLMPSHSDPTSPNFQKMSDLLRGPAFQGSKPISMVLPEYSQNSWIIPLQDQGLEISMPFEDLIGQLESPKLSDKMQMIFNSNVNLSESIMKNTFRAVDESRVKLEDKDLQVELEISELKLHHLEKRVEGCLASSKNTLALNVQLSQNVSKMVSPVKSSQGVLTTNIKTRSNSRINTPRLNPEDSPSPITSQLIESKSEALSIGKNRTKSLTQRIPEAPENNVGMKNLTEMEREKALSAEKRVKSVSLSVQEPNSRLKDSIINEAYQKLTSYFGSGDSKTPEVNNQEEKYEEELATEAVKMRSSHAHSKSTELIMSNNVTFYTNLAEKEVCIDGEEQAKNFARLQSNEYLSEDQEPLQKQNYLFSSKPREAVRVSPSEPKANFMPQEVSLVDADGKERTFILKPKDTLCVERLETIFIVPFGNKVPNLRKAKIRSQLSSFQGSETEECSQIKDNLKHNQNDQTIVGTQSRASLFDNSNVASMNLDKQEHKLSAFGGQAAHESMIQTNGVEDQKDNYLNNLKLQILNHPKCRKFFAADPSSASVRGRSVDISSKENDGLEFYFKQKIQDFREFLNEFEKILPTEPSLSPAKDSITRTNKIKQVKSWEALNKGQGVENINLESKTVENTPRGLSNENQEYMKEKYNSSMKKPMRVIEGLAEQSPLSCNIDTKNKPVRFENSEFRPQRLFKEKQDSPVSIGKVEFISVKPGFYSNVPLKKKVKAAKIGNQKETLQMAPKAIKLSKGNQSIALPSGQNKKTQVKSSSVKSFSQQVKTKKSKDLENSEVMETKKRREKNGIRENSKSIVEVISIGKLPTRANSVVVQK